MSWPTFAYTGRLEARLNQAMVMSLKKNFGFRKEKKGSPAQVQSINSDTVLQASNFFKSPQIMTTVE